MDLGLSGRRAAVAAASGGLGLATAQALAGEGARVAICGRDEGRLDEAATTVSGGAETVVADVSDAEQARAFVATARERLDGLDILVTNAGGPPPGAFSDTELSAYEDALHLNLLSTVAMCREGVPGMRAQGWGRVVGITSHGAREPIPALIASSTARAGATSFLKNLATEVAPDGVTVNSIQPGLHATGRLKQLHGNTEELGRNVPVGFVGEPADFGAVVAFLCSDQAKFVTGAAIPVEGGAGRGLQ